MQRPSLGQIKWFALFLGVFFALSSAAQYLFVSHTTQNKITTELKENARLLSKAIDYKDQVDPNNYFKAELNVRNFISILKDGSILETDLGPENPLRELHLPAHCPFTPAALVSGPISAPYKSETIGEETWTVAAKRVEGGVVIVGFSALDEIPAAKSKLIENLALFGDDLSEPSRQSRNKMDNNLSWAIVDDAARLVDANGRLPLKTDAMLVGQMFMSNRPSEIERGDKLYQIGYSPLRDVSGQGVGTIIQLMDITLERSEMRQHLLFSSGLAVASFLVFLLLAAFYSERKESEKRAIREAFQHYFSPQIMEAILREPERLRPGGQRREVTILFSDIRSFTGLTEKLPPQQLTRLLHEYYDAMTEEVFATDGIVDKYIGDAIMAFWGAPIEQPDQADRAVTTAMNMIKRLRQLQEKWAEEGFSVLDVGIGINLGIATVGNLGSTRRFDYTLVGDAVNAASRIEALTREYQNHIIISDTTKSQLTIPVTTKDLGDVIVRGKEKPIRIYEVTVD